LRSGSATLLGEVSRTWMEIATGQNPPPCSQIRDSGWKSPIPKEFFGQRCFDKVGSNTAVDYTH
jgi:hypothetical protein